MQFFKKILKVRNFDPVSGTAVLMSHEAIFVADESLIYTAPKLTYVKSNGGILFFLNALNQILFVKGLIINEQNLKVLRISETFEKHFVFYKKSDPRLYGVFDIINGVIAFEVEEWIGTDIIADKIYAEEDRRLICRSLIDGLKIWEYDLRKNDFGGKLLKDTVRFYKFIGIYGKQLLIACSDCKLPWIWAI